MVTTNPRCFVVDIVGPHIEHMHSQDLEEMSWKRGDQSGIQFFSQTGQISLLPLSGLR